LDGRLRADLSARPLILGRVNVLSDADALALEPRRTRIPRCRASRTSRHAPVDRLRARSPVTECELGACRRQRGGRRASLPRRS